MTPAPSTTNLKFSARILSAEELRREHLAIYQAMMVLQGKITNLTLKEAAEPWKGYEAALACWGFVVEQEMRRRGLWVKPQGTFTKTMLEKEAKLPDWIAEGV